MSQKSLFLVEKVAITRLESEVLLESQKSSTLPFMTVVFEKHEYHTLTPEKNNVLCLKRLKRDHVGHVQSGGGTVNGKGNGKGPTLKSLNRSIEALATKFDKFTLLNDDDEYESLEEE
jgi:hypothetical protein